MKKLAAFAFATTTFCLQLASAASAGPIGLETGPNLVTNGGFEATTVIAGSNWTPSGFFGEGIDFFVDGIPADAKGGSHAFAGGGVGAPGFISQTLTTVAGTSYNIHLWLANLTGLVDGTEIRVLWGGSQVYSQTNIAGFSYHEIVIDPIATSASTVLSIGLRDDPSFLTIDDVSVRAISTAVPEPATLLLVGLGLSGVAALSRRRRV